MDGVDPDTEQTHTPTRSNLHIFLSERLGKTAIRSLQAESGFSCNWSDTASRAVLLSPQNNTAAAAAAAPPAPPAAAAQIFFTL